MVYSIEPLTDENAFKWEEFIRRCEEGTLFHRIAWKNFLEDAFQLRSKYYLILKDEKVIGICPCIEQTIYTFRGIGSIPHSENNNILLDGSFDINQINDVLALFSKDYSFIKFNTYDPTILDRITYRMFPFAEEGNMVVDLKQKPPDLIWETLSKQTKKHIRGLENKGFEVREMHTPADLEMFYRYYAENVTRIHGSVHSFSVIQKILETFPPEDVRIAALTRGDMFASGTLTIVDRDKKTAYFRYMALNRDLSGRHTPSYPIYWDLITWAWDNGYEKISLGREIRDPNVGSFKNKVKFGADYIPFYPGTVLLSKGMSYLHWLKRALPGR
ncbi:MAG: GNAT family N-acetyltransferase [Methanomicrobiaceae archaeon]|uniref:BioF2-like acetyltransferase domain-containing protein n=1 Tax=hydrocarbon metagenome TaxID=938273 RepID=A0A0W8FFQ2_9ZZZZ|nr:GNAT family N-acetyltransferase [Methanomicrobiaceae archaeon]